MKIGYFIDSKNVGGAEVMLLRLMLQVRAQGHDIVLYHFGNVFLEGECIKHSIATVNIPYEKKFKSIKTLLFFTLLFGRILKKDKIDVLHSNLYGAIVGAYFGCFIYSIKHVGTLHDVYMVEEKRMRAMFLWVSRLCGTKLVTVSLHMQKYYIGRMGGRISVVPNGCELFEKEVDNNIRLKGLQLVTVGRLVELKNHEFLILGLRELFREYDCHLDIVGDGPLMSKLQCIVKENMLESYVSFLGERDDVESILLQSDIFYLVSKSEGLSCSILEAMSASLPCVVTNVGGNGELVKDECGGVVIQLDSISQLVGATKLLLNNPQLRSEMGMFNSKKVEDCYSLVSMCNGYLTLYES